jgi:tetratricopeptide (TPR) repeat protein
MRLLGPLIHLPALQTVERLKQLYPGDPDVLYESAELYTRLWNESAGELMAKHPDSYRVHQLAGEVYEAQNNYDQAIREYSLALQNQPETAPDALSHRTTLSAPGIGRGGRKGDE